MERSKVVINIAKITQINRTLNYLLECNKGEEIDYPTHLHPELNYIDDWAFEIQAYWRECKDPIIAEQIENIGSSGNFYKLLLSARMADDIRGAISRYVNVIGELRAEIKQHQEQSKGAYSMLPDELANDEAAKLLQRAVEAGYLREDYQPGTHTSNAQLRFLAFGIGTALHLKHKWEPFERLWNKEKLPGVYIPNSKSVDFEDIIKLYPGVDFSEISKKFEMNLSNECEIIDPIISEPVHFCSTASVSELKKVYRNLIDYKYLSDKTTLEQWLYFCTGKGEKHEQPLLWNKGLNALALFIDKLLDSSNNNQKWGKASTIFRNKNQNKYELIKIGSICRAGRANKNDSQSAGLQEILSLISVDRRIHYNNSTNLSIDSLKRTYTNLVREKYISDQTSIENWLYVFTGSKEYNENEEPIVLNWIGTQTALAITINKLFIHCNDNTDLWEITRNVFSLKGKEPKIQAMKSAVTKQQYVKTDNKVLSLLSIEKQ